jgi:peptidoglycan/LPS O-acetylase OafA/YrhL
MSTEIRPSIGSNVEQTAGLNRGAPFQNSAMAGEVHICLQSDDANEVGSLRGASPRIAGLDGLRAISIALVLAAHTANMHRVKRLSLCFFLSGARADGVEVFFVISGFIITSLLLREFEAKKSIDLGAFYLRRACRILPPLYIYMAFLVILGLLHYVSPLAKGDFLSSGLFMRDYTIGNGNGVGNAWFRSSWFLDHTWSLSVEEQFYLFWPLLLARLLRSDKEKSALQVTVFIIIISPLIRLLTYWSDIPFFKHRESYMLHTRIDALMFGCLVALTIGSPMFEKMYLKTARVWWLAPIWFLFVSTTLAELLGGAFLYLVGYTLNGICISMFLVWCTRNPTHLLGRFLNNRAMVHLGYLSYGIYIWQQVFLSERTPFHLARSEYAILIILVISEAAHQVVEKPCNWLRDKLLRRRLSHAKPTFSSTAGF